MKHHKIAHLVNSLRDTAVKYKDHQCLRQKIHDTLGEYIDIKNDNDDVNLTAQAIQELEDSKGHTVSNTTELFNEL